jgi:hypothetical protein
MNIRKCMGFSSVPILAAAIRLCHWTLVDEAGVGQGPIGAAVDARLLFRRCRIMVLGLIPDGHTTLFSR